MCVCVCVCVKLLGHPVMLCLILFYIVIQLIYNVSVSVQQSDSVMQIDISILFQILFLYCLLQRTEWRSLLCLIFKKPPYFLYNSCTRFTFPPATHKGCNFSTSSSTFTRFYFGDSRHLKSVKWYILWFWFAVLWWLVMLSIYSCACWPVVYLPGEISTHVLCLCFNWVVCF